MPTEVHDQIFYRRQMRDQASANLAAETADAPFQVAPASPPEVDEAPETPAADEAPDDGAGDAEATPANDASDASPPAPGHRAKKRGQP